MALFGSYNPHDQMCASNGLYATVLHKRVGWKLTGSLLYAVNEQMLQCNNIFELGCHSYITNIRGWKKQNNFQHINSVTNMSSYNFLSDLFYAL